jgi:hypothetical protein
MRARFVLALAALLALASGASGEDAATPAAPAPPPPPCASPEHRAFDFWLGAWRVETPAGKHAGNNTISAILDGCVLLEQWEGAGGVRGTSLNAYDASTRRWRQTWVDASGSVLLLEGGIESGAMVMRGVTREGASEIQERITWTKLEDGAVQQHWQQSRDGGATWTDAFLGIYRRR